MNQYGRIGNFGTYRIIDGDPQCENEDCEAEDDGVSSEEMDHYDHMQELRIERNNEKY